MPIRFRRTFTIFPGVKANVSKSGVSFTVGTKGYHLNFSKRGVKQTVGLPGSGLSHSSYLGKDEPEAETRKKKTKADNDDDPVEEAAGEKQEEESQQAQTGPRRRTPGWVLLIGLVVIYLGALLLGLIPTNFLSQVLDTLTDWARGIGL